MKKTNSANHYDVVIVGAGAAGLSCALELKEAGKKILLLEAQDRVGGRIHSHKDPQLKFPIELGAEFLHGDAPQSRKIFDDLGGFYYDVNEDCFKKTAKGFQKFPFFDSIETYFKKLKGDRKKDRSVKDFLKGSQIPSNMKPYLQSFVEGFHAADVDLIGEKGLAMAEQATGDKDNLKSARLLVPYAELPNSILHKIGLEHVRLNILVKKIEWQPGKVKIQCLDQSAGEDDFFHASAVVVTIPLGVLKAPPTSKAFIEFLPAWSDLERNIQALHMGHISRMVFLFREKFWEKTFPKSLGYLHLGPKYDYATWWGHSPLHTPMLTAWQGGPRAVELATLRREERIQIATKTLAEAFDLKPKDISEQILHVYEHSWSKDPYSLGAYSYIGFDGAEAAKKLSKPKENTLFLCGEATEPGGARGTVEGAIHSGRRAAQQFLRSRKA